MTKENEWTPEELVAFAKEDTKQWAKRVGAKLEKEEDNGNIELWVYGKSHSRKFRTVNYVTATKRPSWTGKFKPYTEELLDTIKFAETRLIEDWQIQPDAHLPTSESGCNCLYYYLNNASNPNSQYKEDDVPTLLAKMIYFAELILSNDTDSDIKLRHAHILGQTINQHDYIVKTAPKNKERASKERYPEINSIIKKISVIDAPTKNLWQQFINYLLGLPEAEISPIERNPHNTETWSVDITYEDTNKEFKTTSMKYSSFASKISRARKKKLSR